MLSRRRRGPLALVALLAAAFAACEVDGRGPVIDDVAGEYHAVDFRYHDGDEQSGNMVDEGGDVDLTLHDDGTSSGSLFIPGEALIDLAGSWEIDGSDVDIDGDANPYVSEISFEWRNDGTLRADESFFGRRVTMVLCRGPGQCAAASG